MYIWPLNNVGVRRAKLVQLKNKQINKWLIQGKEAETVWGDSPLKP